MANAPLISIIKTAIGQIAPEYTTPDHAKQITKAAVKAAARFGVGKKEAKAIALLTIFLHLEADNQRQAETLGDRLAAKEVPCHLLGQAVIAQPAFRIKKATSRALQKIKKGDNALARLALVAYCEVQAPKYVEVASNFNIPAVLEVLQQN